MGWRLRWVTRVVCVLLESHGKARSNSTTAVGHGERCSRGALRLARTTSSQG